MKAALKAYRKYERISQAEMGKRMELSGSYISMLETGGREWTKPLMEKLATLIEASGMGRSMATGEPAGMVSSLRQQHRERVVEAIISRIKDLQMELHKQEKKIAAWKKAFTTAQSEYYAGEVYVTQGAGKMPPGILREKEMEMYDAHQTLKKICHELPELTLIRIEGVKAEVKSAKKTLKKLQRSGPLETGLPFGNEQLGITPAAGNRGE